MADWIVVVMHSPSTIRVSSPPQKPLVIFDGDCGFCRSMVTRARRVTRAGVDYLPFQDSTVRERFPELAITDLEKAMHLIGPDGAVYRGADAAFRTIAPACRWPHALYRRSPLFAHASEWVYRFVAAHRPFFSVLSRPFLKGE